MMTKCLFIGELSLSFIGQFEYFLAHYNSVNGHMTTNKLYLSNTDLDLNFFSSDFRPLQLP